MTAFARSHQLQCALRSRRCLLAQPRQPERAVGDKSRRRVVCSWLGPEWAGKVGHNGEVDSTGRPGQWPSTRSCRWSALLHVGRTLIHAALPFSRLHPSSHLTASMTAVLPYGISQQADLAATGGSPSLPWGVFCLDDKTRRSTCISHRSSSAAMCSRSRFCDPLPKRQRNVRAAPLIRVRSALLCCCLTLKHKYPATHSLLAAQRVHLHARRPCPCTQQRQQIAVGLMT